MWAAARAPIHAKLCFELNEILFPIPSPVPALLFPPPSLTSLSVRTQRKSARAVKRRNFADLEEPPPEDDDSWEIGDDSDAERAGGGGGGGSGSSSKKRRRPSSLPGGPAEDRRFGEAVQFVFFGVINCCCW